MKAIDKMNKWANARTNIVVDLLRVAMGVFFFYKGIQFSDQTQLLVDLIQPDSRSFVPLLIAHYVVMGHIAGGILIVFGLLTRLACLVQLPIIVGAVIMNFMIMDVSSLVLLGTCLIFTLFFIVFGSGKHSVDYTMKLHF